MFDNSFYAEMGQKERAEDEFHIIDSEVRRQDSDVTSQKEYANAEA
jgi:hypothetical protein